MTERPGTEIADPEQLIATLAAALTSRSLYPPAHPRVGAAIARAIATLDQFLDATGTDEVAILRVGDDLAVAGQALRGGGVVVRGFRNTLERREIEALTPRRGLDAAELAAFLGDLCEGRGAASTPHLHVGRVAATVGGGPEIEAAPPAPIDEASARALADLTVQQGISPEVLSGARQALEEAGSGAGAADVAAIERLVWQAIDALALAAESILPLAPITGEEDELFQHSLRVCYLTLGLGRALGFRGEPLRDLGVAAFLHDVGKIALPRELLARKGRLDDASWRLLQTHCEVGAARLCGVEGVPTVAVLVAFEHHLRADGRPSFPRLRSPRRPCLASQITAVVDAYDAYYTAVASQGNLGHLAALALLETRAKEGALQATLVQRLAEALPARAS